MFKWVSGRLNTGYQKMALLIIKWPFQFDAYLLKYGVGSEIRPHRDVVDGYKHYRVNVVLRHAKTGGVFVCLGAIYKSTYLNIFRSDLSTHSITRVNSGTRLVLSLGLAIKDGADK